MNSTCSLRRNMNIKIVLFYMFAATALTYFILAVSPPLTPSDSLVRAITYTIISIFLIIWIKKGK